MAEEKPAFLDGLTRIFRRRDEGREPEAPESSGDDRLQQLVRSFDSAVSAIWERVEDLRAEAGEATLRAGKAKRRDPEAERRKRLADIHMRIRGEIEQMHAQLGTGLKADDLDAIIDELEGLEPLVNEGRNSYELLPRVRFAIVEKLREESGRLAVTRIRALLERASMSWPDPIRAHPRATAEEIERARRRRLAETRQSFMGEGCRRTAQRSVGVVTGWGSDYPDPGSSLWQEAVLEGVAAGIRGDLIRAFYATIRRDRDQLITPVEELLGNEVDELHRLGAEVDSIRQANRVVARALQAATEAVPELAWRHVCEQDPRARGEWSD